MKSQSTVIISNHDILLIKLLKNKLNPEISISYMNYFILSRNVEISRRVMYLLNKLYRDYLRNDRNEVRDSIVRKIKKQKYGIKSFSFSNKNRSFEHFSRERIDSWLDSICIL